MKVLYCIALLLIGWSSAKTTNEKLDKSKLIYHCRRRNGAYVKEQVAEFGDKAVVDAKAYGVSCLMHVLLSSDDPFCEQCKNETAVLVEYLLGIGADANDKVRFPPKIRAISVATQRRNIPAMEILLAKGADIEIKDDLGQTAIFYTIRDNHYHKHHTDGSSALRLLIKNGANIDAKDHWGRTALMWATKNDKPAMNLLIENGANINAQDKKGQTALDVATNKGDEPVMELLLDAEKKQSGH